MDKRYILIKNLPDTTAGTVFKLNKNNDSYEAINSHGRIIKFYQHEIDRNPEWFEFIDDQWSPNIGEEYFYFLGHGDVCRAERGELYGEIDFMKYGNCFQTKEQAAEAARRVKETLLKYHEELNHE